MIKVHKFGPAFGMPDASPFVVKVETYLRMTDQKYETVIGDVRKAPRSQLPFADIDGKIVTDSSSILEHLESARDKKLDAHLDAKQRAVGLAFKTMLEEHLYFGVLYMRWTTDDGWTVFRPALLGMLGVGGVPGILRGVISKSARKHVSGRARLQGMGRRPREEVVARCNEMTDALSEQLGDGQHMFGDKLSTYDATVYAFATGMLCPAFDNEIHKHAKSKKNLVAYADRMKSAYWKDV